MQQTRTCLHQRFHANIVPYYSALLVIVTILQSCHTSVPLHVYAFVAPSPQPASSPAPGGITVSDWADLTDGLAGHTITYGSTGIHGCAPLHSPVLLSDVLTSVLFVCTAATVQLLEHYSSHVQSKGRPFATNRCGAFDTAACPCLSIGTP